MSEENPSELPPPIVHGLLVCRNVEMVQEGRLDLREVLEVIALDEMPGDAGPLAFVAFVRGLQPGPCTFHFVIRPAGNLDHEVARYPLKAEIHESFLGRQMAIQMKVPSIPVQQGGVFDLVFEWEGTPLSANRFAIGTKGAAPGEG